MGMDARGLSPQDHDNPSTLHAETEREAMEYRCLAALRIGLALQAMDALSAFVQPDVRMLSASCVTPDVSRARAVRDERIGATLATGVLPALTGSNLPGTFSSNTLVEGAA